MGVTDLLSWAPSSPMGVERGWHHARKTPSPPLRALLVAVSGGAGGLREREAGVHLSASAHSRSRQAARRTHIARGTQQTSSDSRHLNSPRELMLPQGSRSAITGYHPARASPQGRGYSATARLTDLAPFLLARSSVPLEVVLGAIGSQRRHRTGTDRTPSPGRAPRGGMGAGLLRPSSVRPPNPATRTAGRAHDDRLRRRAPRRNRAGEREPSPPPGGETRPRRTAMPNPQLELAYDLLLLPVLYWMIATEVTYGSPWHSEARTCRASK